MNNTTKICITLIICVALLIFGVLNAQHEEIEFLTNYTQDQFDEIQQLNATLQKCYYDAGVVDEIVVAPYVVRE